MVHTIGKLSDGGRWALVDEYRGRSTGGCVATELETGTSTITEIDPELDTRDPGDHDRFAHYVPKGELTKAMVTGVACIALCGKKWVPSRKPEDFPVCPDCKRIYDQRAAGGR
jgi:hypothetical protein